MKISLIVAMSRQGVIGRNDDLPWRLSADLQRFKKITLGHHIIMGRRTFESIGRCLPGRTTVILTRNTEYSQQEASVVPSLDQALLECVGDEEVFIIGGAQVYQLALPRIDRLYITLVHGKVSGDTHFPAMDWSQWRKVEDDRHCADQKNEYDYSFRVYERVSQDKNDLKSVIRDPSKIN